ncbi:MAG: transketolase [Verrucomicrobia bacterium]|nr:transketolase [Verrucomicrobiota bacterium]
MEDDLKKSLGKIALTIRDIAMDATQAANSGHPGLPMGCAELGAYLWGVALQHNPKNSHWINRDRFVLSAGHGCLLQYACLHLSGYKLTLDEIKHFRQLHSQTPGHPEFGHTDGIEVTTGPLGQGVGNAVGLALASKLLADKFNTPEISIFNNKVFCLAGDGCIMEGVTSEASSLAGHLGLNNLILLYDSNKICLDGPLSECCSEDTASRYKAYGWEVHELDGYDFDAMDTLFTKLREKQTKPAFVVVRTIIGKGSPHKAGSHEAHGSPLGEEEVRLTKQELDLPAEPFFIPQAIRTFFEEKLKKDVVRERLWQERFDEWARIFPHLYGQFVAMRDKALPLDLEEQLKKLEIKAPIAGRSASFACLKLLGNKLPFLIGGSADLSGSDMTMMKEFPIVAPGVFKGRNIKYGVREFGMATIMNGLARSEMYLPFGGTFLTFSDYMRNAIRLAALMKVQVIYHFTHDSIFLGEDGPTHQGVEHLMSLRAIPNLHVIRPADTHEVKMAWMAALLYKGPTALILSRQKNPDVAGTCVPYTEGMGRGAYIVKRERSKPDYTLIATGSELSLAMQTAQELEKRDHDVRVISMPCWELFDAQDLKYREAIFGGDLGKRVSIEAGCDLGWYRYIGREGIAISVDTFGASAPASALATEYGFTVDEILERILV